MLVVDDLSLVIVKINENRIKTIIYSDISKKTNFIHILKNLNEKMVLFMIENDIRIAIRYFIRSLFLIWGKINSFFVYEKLRIFEKCNKNLT